MCSPPIDKLWDYNNPAATEARFRELLPAVESQGDAGHLAELLSQLARAQGLQRHFDAAHQTLDRAEGLLTPQTPRARIRCLLERGRVHNSSGRPADALPFFHQAYDLARAAAERRLAVDAIHMIAIAQPTPGQQVEWNLKGITAARELDQPGWLPALYNNLGEAYAAQHDYENALGAFRAMDQLDTDAGRPPDPFARKDIGKMLRKLGRLDEAVAVLQPVHASLRAAGQVNGYVEEELAECLLAQGHPDQAKPLFRQAFDEQRKDPHVELHDVERLARLERLAR